MENGGAPRRRTGGPLRLQTARLRHFAIVNTKITISVKFCHQYARAVIPSGRARRDEYSM